MKSNPVNGESVSVKNLADFLGVAQTTVYYWLSGKTTPEYEQLIAISGYFSVSIDYLFTGKKPENKTLRDSLHLSDSAINNLETYNKDLTPFIDKLLSDKEFFIEFQVLLNRIQGFKLSEEEFDKYNESVNHAFSSRLAYLEYARSSLDIYINFMCNYFRKFCNKEVIGTEFPELFPLD